MNRYTSTGTVAATVSGSAEFATDTRPATLSYASYRLRTARNNHPTAGQVHSCCANPIDQDLSGILSCPVACLSSPYTASNTHRASALLANRRIHSAPHYSIAKRSFVLLKRYRYGTRDWRNATNPIGSMGTPSS